MVPATSPLTAEWAIAAARESDPWLADNPAPIPRQLWIGAGFLRLTPSSNIGKDSVHCTWLHNCSPTLGNGPHRSGRTSFSSRLRSPASLIRQRLLEVSHAGRGDWHHAINQTSLGSCPAELRILWTAHLEKKTDEAGGWDP